MNKMVTAQPKLKEGDMVQPSRKNPMYKALLPEPLRVHRVEGDIVWIEYKTKTGRIRNERWFVEFWDVVTPKEAT